MAIQNWRFLLSPWYLLLGLLAWVPPLNAEVTTTPIVTADSWKSAQNYTSLIKVFGRQVPLPDGAWVVAGVGVDPMLGQPARAYGVIATLILFKLDGPEVVAFTLIHANAIALDGGWGISRDCQRSAPLFAKIYENGEQHAFCAFVRSITTALEPNDQDLPAWQDAMSLAHSRGWHIPTRWHEAGFRICDWRDVLDIRYAFKTQILTMQQHQPQISEIEDTPDAVLIRWIDTMVPRVYLGFKRALAGQPVPGMPGDPKYSVQEEWAHPQEQQSLSNSAFSLWKVAINRIVNIGSSLGIDYLFLGNIYLAVSLQVVSSTFHGGVDYVEELLWNTYGPQRLHQATSYDFTYVGREE